MDSDGYRFIEMDSDGYIIIQNGKEKTPMEYYGLRLRAIDRDG